MDHGKNQIKNIYLIPSIKPYYNKYGFVIINGYQQRLNVDNWSAMLVKELTTFSLALYSRLNRVQSKVSKLIIHYNENNNYR